MKGQNMLYLFELWGTHGWWLLMLPGAGALLLLFLLTEIIQVAFVRRRLAILVVACLNLVVLDAGIGYILFLTAGMPPRWAVWVPLVVTGGMFLAALLAEVKLVRRWFTERWPRTGTVTSNRLNVRDAPDGEVVRELLRGEHVQVIDTDQSGDWFQIDENEWVSTHHVQL